MQCILQARRFPPPLVPVFIQAEPNLLTGHSQGASVYHTGSLNDVRIAVTKALPADRLQTQTRESFQSKVPHNFLPSHEITLPNATPARALQRCLFALQVASRLMKSLAGHQT
ncbi:UNVERIFIED_CONTAM: hypothetical protein K2H54_064978 [Gekko kuhli]